MKKPTRRSGRKGGGHPARRMTLAAGTALLLPVTALPVSAGPPQGNPPAVSQLPTGGVVAAGSAGIAQSGAQMTVTQTTSRAIVNWESFNVGAGASVTFRQPDAGSAILNRVSDPNPSRIHGTIQANGQVFLTNPNGVYFAPGASVDVGGLVATTHSIRDADFMAGTHVLERNGATGRVTNDGTLRASLGGYIALLAPEVRNNGVIVARMGTVALAAGEAYTLRFSGDGALTDLQVAPATVKALVRNRHAVEAPGGLIVLSAQAVNQLRGSVVNSGQLEASGLVSDGGTIRLRASGDITVGGTVAADAAPGSTGKGGSVTAVADLDAGNSRTIVKGTISARGGGKGGDGGFVETSGGRVRIRETARVDTRAPRGKAGQWLIDPDGFTIASSGGDITGATLSANLATGDVNIRSTNGSGSDGNVTVNDAVTWSANTLTLTATNDVNVNAVMTAKDTAKLDLEPGSGKVNTGFNGNGTFKGRVDFLQADGTTPRSGTGFLTINGDDFTVITAVGAEGSNTGTDLQGINLHPGDKYALGANIDASATSGWASGAGFSPLAPTSFSGIFDGLGHTINGLVINRPTATTSVGLFSYGKGATVRNVGITGGSIVGKDGTGALLGKADTTTISNVYSTAPVTGSSYTGGLIGDFTSGTLSRSRATGAVSGGSYVGGLIGQAGTPAVSLSFSTGAVSGAGYVGGLVGKQTGGSLTDVYTTGTVTATGNTVGGLLGANAGATVNRGLAANSITASGTDVGALVGVQTSGSIANSFYDSSLAATRTGFGDGTADAVGTVLGRTTTQLRNIATYEAAGWSIGVDTSLSSGYASLGVLQGTSSSTWVIGNLPVYVRLVAGSSTYGDTPGPSYAIYDASSGGNLIADVTGSGTATWSTPLTGTLSAGSYSETYAGGLTASRTGYTLNAGIATTWTVTPRPITVRANDQTRIYGAGNPGSGGATLVSGTLVNGDTLGSVALGSPASGSTAAGQTAALTPGSLALSSGSVGNYAVTYANGTLTIDKAPLTITAADVGRTYDGLTYSGGGGVSYSGFANGEGASVLGGTLSYGGNSQGAVNAGSYTIAPGGLTSSNYAVTYANGTLTIGKASLVVAAAGLTKTYDGRTFSGGAGVSYSGFVNGEGTAVLGGTMSYGGSSQGAVDAGSYAITPGGLSSNNYAISYGSGTLTIDKAPLLLTGGNASKTYDGRSFTGGAGVSYSGFVNGEGASVLGGTLSYGGSSQGAVNAGSYAITPGGLTSNNYAISYGSGTLTVGKARLTVAADDKSRFFGDGNPPLTYSIAGFVNGETADTAGIAGAPRIATGAGTATPVGSARISASVDHLSATNYDFAATDGTLTILPSPILVSIPTTTVTGTTATGTTATVTTATATGTSPVPVPVPINSPSGTVVTVALEGPGGSGTPSNPSGTNASPAILPNGGESQRTAPVSAAISVNLVQAPAAQSSGVVTVSVPKDFLTQNGGFTFKLPDRMTEGTTDGVSITATTAEGSPLPNWLRFNADSKTFVAANVPDGGLPISVAVFVDGQRTDMTIAERG